MNLDYIVAHVSCLIATVRHRVYDASVAVPRGPDEWVRQCLDWYSCSLGRKWISVTRPWH